MLYSLRTIPTIPGVDALIPVMLEMEWQIGPTKSSNYSNEQANGIQLSFLDRSRIHLLYSPNQLYPVPLFLIWFYSFLSLHYYHHHLSNIKLYRFPLLAKQMKALPKYLVLDIGGLRVGIIHGDTQSLSGTLFSLFLIDYTYSIDYLFLSTIRMDVLCGSNGTS